MPADRDALLALPGIGSYTAAAVASFAFGQRHAVLDTNVRRVLARLVAGEPRAGRRAVGGGKPAGRIAAARRAAVAARWSVAVMELGALVCTAASPRCDACPAAAKCAWLAAGPSASSCCVSRPVPALRRHRPAAAALLAVPREAPPGEPAAFDPLWAAPAQLARALDGLVADGLVDPLPDGRYALPGFAATDEPGVYGAL